ncbi:MAG: aminotransferase class III-fold pyridoxal phosphate-dependent enzyme [SAR202 cluster bacterium]|nr:aspartate aminotransferase family protein [Chloroflexota bacterium]MQG51359.1 aminotransferase class III-fold pyridoxal phosphate-dependent enzyme [SAR202 cluster bacterium]|tara:strand:- start:5715 stop:7013 length:1299 start_codon:yes stop_codon:yes gene_type:complete
MYNRKPQSKQEQISEELANKYMPAGNLGNMSSKFEQGFIVSHGKGSKIYDLSGNEYIDYLIGSGPMILGHANESVVKAVQTQMEKGSTFFLNNESIIELAEEVCSAVPCAEMIRFTTSGTDATFQCLRVARAYTGKDKILKFEGGYHGSHDYALMSQVPTLDKEFPEPEPDSAGIPKVIAETVLIAPYNDIETTESIIKKEKDNIAAVIVEPVQRIISPTEGFLKQLRELTIKYNIPLIFDEVVTGFRLSYGGAQEFFGVVPDLASFGKIVGGGFPLAAVAGKKEIMEHYDGALHQNNYIPQTGTLNGNPIAAVAGLATLKQLKDPSAYNRLHEIGTKLKKALADSMQQYEIEAQITGDNTVFDIVFTNKEINNYRDLATGNSALLSKFNNLMLNQGILKPGNKLYMSLALTDEDIEKTIKAFSYSASKLRD